MNKSIRHPVTAHACKRAQQRGFKQKDIEFVQVFGTAVSKGWLLSRQDRDHIIKEAKYLISQSERLTDVLVCTADDGTVKTVFHATPRQQKRALRTSLTGEW